VLGRPLFIRPSRDLPAAEHYDDVVMSLIVGRPNQIAVCAARRLTVPPSSYLRRFHVDSNVWSLPASGRDAVRWRYASRLFGLEPARVGA
jgi:hypothetical protein